MIKKKKKKKEVNAQRWLVRPITPKVHVAYGITSSHIDMYTFSIKRALVYSLFNQTPSLNYSIYHSYSLISITLSQIINKYGSYWCYHFLVCSLFSQPMVAPLLLLPKQPMSHEHPAGTKRFASSRKPTPSHIPRSTFRLHNAWLT